MSFLKKFKRSGNSQKSTKKRLSKVIYTILSLIAVFVISFFSYIYANGSKIFDNGNSSPIFDIIKGEQSSILKEDRTNIVFLGRGGDNHPGGFLTDSIMVVSIDSKDKKLAMINVPRDLYVPIKGHGQAKINEAYADGYNDYMAKSCKSKKKDDCRNEAQKAAANLSRQTISEVFGVPIHYYVTADFEGFEKVIDELGGIDVNVEKTIYDPLFPADNMKSYAPFTLKAGQQHLSGVTALKYARSRETTSDFDRSRRQQQIILATKDKAISSGVLTNPKKIVSLTSILGDHLRTDLSSNEIKDLMTFVKDIDKSKIKNQILSTESGGPLVSDSSSGTYYIRTRKNNFDELHKIAENIFKEVDKTSVKIEITNGTKTASYATNLSTALTNDGYKPTLAKNTAETYKKTLIYDYSKGKQKDTVDYLKDLLDVVVVEKTPDSSISVDLKIIIGDDFKNINIKK